MGSNVYVSCYRGGRLKWAMMLWMRASPLADGGEASARRILMRLSSGREWSQTLYFHFSSLT